MKIENEFFPVIAGPLGSSLETANEYQRRLEEFNPIFEVNILQCWKKKVVKISQIIQYRKHSFKM